MSKYKNGDKVVIRKDLKVGEVYGECYWCDGTEYMKEKDYVVIEGVDEDGDFLVEGGWCINDEMIEGLYKDVKKYVWYLVSEDGAYFLCFDGAVYKYNSPANEDLKKSKHISFLLTEEEARKSPFFDKFEKHDPFEKWYYIHMKGNNTECLNLNVIEGRYSMDDNDEYGPHKVKFNEKEADEIIGTSTILYKEECR